MSGEQHAEFVDAVDDVVHQNSLPLLLVVVTARQLMDGHHCRIARVICVVSRRPIDDLRAVLDCVVVRKRDCLAVRNAKAIEVACTRSPGTHPRRGSGLHEIDRRQAAEIMPFPVTREIPLMRTPAHFARLATFADEAVDGPGIDELSYFLRDVCAL